MTVPFEPIAIGEFDGRPAAMSEKDGPTFERKSRSRRIRRFLGELGGFFSMSLFAGMYLLLNSAMGRRGLGLLIAAALMLVGVLSYLRRRLRKRSVWIAPGVVFRRVKPSSDRPQSFRSQACVLLWRPQDKCLSIAGPEGLLTTEVDPEEGEFVTRAWISPLEPPTEEQLEHFLAGR